MSFAICSWCEKPMEIGAGCTTSMLEIDGRLLARIKSGDEGYDWGTDEPCHDCNVTKGQFHHYNCDVERCPICRKQLLSCGCGEE